MKICIVTPNVILNDGQGRVNYEIICEAIRRQHQITIVSKTLATDLLNHPQVTWISHKSFKYPSQLLRDLHFAAQSWVWLKKNAHEFDVVQVDGSVTIYPADFNVVHFVHSAWLKSPVHLSKTRKDLYGLYQWIYSSINSRREKDSFAKAKNIIAVSERVKQELQELGVPENKITVIHNGVDTDEFQLGESNRKELELPPSVRLALFIGDLKTNRKNLDTVFKALQHLPNTHLAIVGNFQGSPYPTLAKTLHLDHQVHFMGRRHDIPKVMQSCDFFVFPSRYEPFGMVVTEAMASGLPVIISTSTGAAEISDSSCSVLVDPEDVTALINAMDSLSQNAELCLKMGDCARSIAEQHTWSSKAIHYINLYEERCVS